MTALGINAGKSLMRLISPDLMKKDHRDDLTIMGFNLHASKAIEAKDRIGLEHILRYMGRPPISKERPQMAPDGERLLLTLKSPRRDGTEKIFLTPFELLERLTALIPPPRKNQILYHGFFAPHSHLRREIVANRVELCYQSPDKKIGRPDFAKLMVRVFAIDILECPRCKSRMQVISFVHEQKAVRDILTSLKMSTAPPEFCGPDDRIIEFDAYQVDYVEENLPETES